MNLGRALKIGHWTLPQKLLDLNNLWPYLYYKVFCRLPKLIQVESATLQSFQLVFKHLQLLEKISRLIPFFKTLPLISISISQISRLFQEFKTLYEPYGVLQRLCNLIPTSAKLHLVKSAILPHLTYCQTVWHFCHSSDARKLVNEFKNEHYGLFIVTTIRCMRNSWKEQNFQHFIHENCKPSQS